MSADRSLGVITPIFLGSLIGVIVSTILGGIAYLKISGLTYSVSNDPAGENTWVIVVFCCLLCVRYYSAIVFHAYEPTGSTLIVNISLGRKLTIFFTQTTIIIGCSLVLGVMPFYGASGASLVIFFQALLVMVGYWFVVGSIVLTGDAKDQYKISLVGDTVVLMASIAFALYKIQESTSNDNIIGIGMLLGMAVMIFLIEVVTRYQRSMKLFITETVNYFKG